MFDGADSTVDRVAGDDESGAQPIPLTHTDRWEWRFYGAERRY